MIKATGIRWAELENWDAVTTHVALMAKAEPWNEARRDQVAEEVEKAWAGIDGRKHVLRLWREAQEKVQRPEPAPEAAPVVKRRKIETPLSDAELKAVQQALALSSPKTQPERAAQPAKPASAKSLLDAGAKVPPAPEPPAGASELEKLTYPHGLLGHVVQYIVDTAQLPVTRISSKGQTGNVSEIPSTLQTLWGLATRRPVAWEHQSREASR